MGAVTGNVVFLVTSQAGKSMQSTWDGDGHGPGRQPCSLERCSTNCSSSSGALYDSARIQALEAELLQYRHMLEKMVRQRTVQLSRRLALLRACNMRLCDEFGNMREKYLELLSKVQANCQGNDANRISTRQFTAAGMPERIKRVYRYRLPVVALNSLQNTGFGGLAQRKANDVRHEPDIGGWR